MRSNTEKKPWTNLQNLYKNWSKGIKINLHVINFIYLTKKILFDPKNAKIPLILTLIE